MDRRIDLSMKNNVVELKINDLTVLLVDGICMKNSTEEDNVRKSALIKRRWARGDAEYCSTDYVVQQQSIRN